VKILFRSWFLIRLIGHDVYRGALREKMMYSFLLLSFLFILLANVPYVVNDPGVFENQLPMATALQVGFVAINIFILLIAVFVSLSTMQNYLAFERLELLLFRPLRRWQIMAGVLLGLYKMILINWFLMTAGVWLVIVSHEPTLAFFVWKGFSVMALLGLLYVSLVVFFYSLLPNVIAGVMAVFVVIAGFGVPSAGRAFAGLSWPQLLEQMIGLALRLLPQIHALLAIALKELLIFRIPIAPAGYLFHAAFLMILLNIVACLIFERKSQF